MKRRGQSSSTWLAKPLTPGKKRGYPQAVRLAFLQEEMTDEGISMALAGIKSNPEKKVYQADLSAIISKYIGETEKNLRDVFARAEEQDLVLVFEEADALFQKRTETKDAHDRYANREVKYLLRLLASYEGPVVLVFNRKNNIDSFFLGRMRL